MISFNITRPHCRSSPLLQQGLPDWSGPDTAGEVVLIAKYSSLVGCGISRSRRVASFRGVSQISPYGHHRTLPRIKKKWLRHPTARHTGEWSDTLPSRCSSSRRLGRPSGIRLICSVAPHPRLPLGVAPEGVEDAVHVVALGEVRVHQDQRAHTEGGQHLYHRRASNPAASGAAYPERPAPKEPVSRLDPSSAS